MAIESLSFGGTRIPTGISRPLPNLSGRAPITERQDMDKDCIAGAAKHAKGAINIGKALGPSWSPTAGATRSKARSRTPWGA